MGGLLLGLLSISKQRGRECTYTLVLLKSQEKDQRRNSTTAPTKHAWPLGLMWDPLILMRGSSQGWALSTPERSLLVFARSLPCHSCVKALPLGIRISTLESRFKNNQKGRCTLLHGLPAN